MSEITGEVRITMNGETFTLVPPEKIWEQYAELGNAHADLLERIGDDKRVMGAAFKAYAAYTAASGRKYGPPATRAECDGAGANAFRAYLLRKEEADDEEA